MKTTMINYNSHGFSQSLPDVSSENVLIMVYGNTDYLFNSTPFQHLHKKYPNATFCGCSTAGEIFGTRIFDNSLSIAIIEFLSSTIKSHSVSLSDEQDSFTVGKLLASQFPLEGLKGLFVLSDGIDINGTDLVNGVNEVVGDDILVTGGLAGDGDRFQKTWVVKGNKPESGVVNAIGFYGEVELRHGSKGGWQPFGIERVVTRSEKNVLYELDNQPALTIYKEYLGALAKGLPATGLRFPLSLGKKGDDKRLVRTILAVDEDSGSLTFAGDVPEGYSARLMQANFDQLVNGAEEAASNMGNFGEEAEGLCIAISCVGRRMVLGEEAEEEVEAVRDVLPKNFEQLGFYSYGELSPYASGSCDLHNQTMTLTVLSEPA